MSIANIRMVLICGVFFFQNTLRSANLQECYDLKRTPLTTIISEPEDDKEHYFFTETSEDNSMVSLIKQTDGVDTYISGESLLEGPVVLSKSDGYDALILELEEGFTLKDGGKLQLIYLYNGINKDYRSRTFILKPSNGEKQSQEWTLSTDQGIRVDRMYLISRKIFGRLIGIKRIDINERSIEIEEEEEPIIFSSTINMFGWITTT